MTTLWRAKETKKGTKGKTQTDRQTDTLKEITSHQGLGYAANQAGTRALHSADLLSTEVGCLPRRVR